MTDYVVVGAGSAGCVLAARLSEDPAAEVVLIEAGGPDSAPEIHVPVALGQLLKSQYDWDYSSQPEPGLDGRFIYLPRGKTLGGSSSLNAMIYIRGHRADYDGWAADGAKGWSYDEVLPYFRKAESNERGEDQFHGKFGPLSVCESRSRHPLMDAFVRAAVEAGYPENPDFNGANQDGAGLVSVHPAQRHALQYGRGLSASGDEPAQPQGHHRRSRDANYFRSRPRDRSRDRAQRDSRGDPCRYGSDRRRRRL